MDDDQAALLADMHALLLRRGTESVAAVIQQYHRDVAKTHRILSPNRRSADSASVISWSSSVRSSDIPSDDESEFEFVPTPARNKGKGVAQPSPLVVRPPQHESSSSSSSQAPSLPSPKPLSHRPSQPLPHTPERSVGSSSQPRQRPQYTPTPVSFNHRNSPQLQHCTTPTAPPRYDSPPPSPDLESPPPSPGSTYRPPSLAREVRPPLVENLNIFSYLIRLEHAPENTVPTVCQDRATGPQDRWYYVLKGRKVGVFNNWSSVAHAVNGVSGNIQHRAANRHVAYMYFRDALTTGRVTVVYDDNEN